MAAISFVRMYPTDWRSGCLGLSLEQEGLYIRICMFIAETGRRVPLDDSQAARMLAGVNINQYRKVLGQLLLLGKIKRHDDGYGNDRAEAEVAAAKGAVGRTHVRGAVLPVTPPVSPTATQVVTTQATPPATPAVEPEKSEADQGLLRESGFKTLNEKTVAEHSAQEVDWHALHRDLRAAGGDMLASEAVAPGLANLSTPLWWLDQGCDFERDVLATIREVCRRRSGRGGAISSWDYFNAAVANAKAKREGKLPEVQARMAAVVAAQPRTDWAADRIARARALQAKLNLPAKTAATEPSHA